MENGVFKAPPPVFPCPDSPDILRPEFVTAAAVSAITIESRDYWCRLIREQISPYYRQYFPPDKKRSKESVQSGHLERLLDASEFAGISEIWKNSEFVTDLELQAAGGQKGKPLTKQSFSRKLQELAERAGEAADIATYEARASRLVDAMLCHQLLEEEFVRTNFKPLRATRLLNGLMLAYNTNVGMLWRHALLDAYGSTSNGEFNGGSTNG